MGGSAKAITKGGRCDIATEDCAVPRLECCIFVVGDVEAMANGVQTCIGRETWIGYADFETANSSGKMDCKAESSSCWSLRCCSDISSMNSCMSICGCLDQMLQLTSSRNSTIRLVQSSEGGANGIPTIWIAFSPILGTAGGLVVSILGGGGQNFCI